MEFVFTGLLAQAIYSLLRDAAGLVPAVGGNDQGGWAQGLFVAYMLAYTAPHTEQKIDLVRFVHAVFFNERNGAGGAFGNAFTAGFAIGIRDTAVFQQYRCTDFNRIFRLQIKMANGARGANRATAGAIGLARSNGRHQTWAPKSSEPRLHENRLKRVGGTHIGARLTPDT